MVIINTDHAGNINRLIDIIKATDDLFDDPDSKERMRKVLFAEPDFDIVDDTTPYCYVYVPARFQFTRESIGGRTADFLQTLVEYYITVIVQRKSPEVTQKTIFKLTDKIIAALKANPLAGEPATPANDPKFIRSNIARIERFRPQIGRSVDGARIVLSAQVGTEWQLDLPGGLTLDLISKPLDTEGIAKDEDLTDDGAMVVTRMANPGTWDVEFNSDFSIDSTIKILIDGLEKPVTLRRGTESKNRTAVLVELRKPVAYDNVDKSILSLRLIA